MPELIQSLHICHRGHTWNSNGHPPSVPQSHLDLTPRTWAEGSERRSRWGVSRLGHNRFGVTTRELTLDGSTHLGVLSVRRIFLVAGQVSSTVLSSGYAATLPSRHWIVVSRRTSHSHTLPTTGIRHRNASLRDSSLRATALWGGQHRRDELPPLPPTSPLFWS